jgi:hypothetical protein
MQKYQTYHVNIEWLVKDRVILIRPVGDFESHIALEAVAEVKQMVNEGIHPVHLIVDTSRVTTHLRDPRIFGTSLDSLRYNRNIGRLVFIYTNHFARFAGELLARFLGVPFRLASTHSHALEILSRLDVTLTSDEVDSIPA